jgi:hypothetical protein
MVDDPPAAVNLTVAQARESLTRHLRARNKAPCNVQTYLAPGPSRRALAVQVRD